MKRDLLLLFLCLCILGAAAYVGRDNVVYAIAASPDEGRVLILDAGHGGEDGGASTASGSRESDINLSIVQKTEALMAFLGVRTELTRMEDRSMHSEGASTIREKKVSDLKNRVAFVGGFSNAMLISVHQNHFTDTRYSGAQVFYNMGDVSRQWCYPQTTTGMPRPCRMESTCLSISVVRPFWWSADFSATGRRHPCCSPIPTSVKSLWRWQERIGRSYK